MFRSNKDLEKSLNESNTKMKSDVERSLRGLNFGRLYLKNGEFDTAIKYVNQYLSVRPNSSEAYKLLAQINEAVGDNDTALINYRKSLELRKQNSDNYSFLTPSKNESFSSSVTTYSPVLTHNNSIDTNNSNINNKTFTDNERKEETPQTPSQSGTHSCGICSNEKVLIRIAKQQENLIETNKIILDIIKQNNSNISDIQQQLVIIHDSLNGLTDSQNVLKETLYDFVTQEHEGFDDYDPDEKENSTLDSSDLLNANESQTNKWQSPSLQIESQLDQKKPLSELFKPPSDSWQCDVCYVQNNISHNSCIACETPNPVSLTIQPQTDQGFKSNTFSFQPTFTSSTTGFNFGSINADNSIFSNNTFKFGNTSTNDALPSFGSNSFLQSNKAIDQSQQNIFSNSKINSNNGVSFQFGLSRDFDFKFSENLQKDEAFKSPKSPKSPAGPNLSQELEDENSSFTEHPEPSNADSIYFQPVVPLPPKIEVKTGEEEEKVLHSCRARLFRFSDNEWKERGIGELKILLSPDSKRVRIVMRRDTVLKVCLNQYITPDLKLDLKEDNKSMTWSAIDYSEDTPTPEIFLLRLKNPENAGLFIEAFKSAQQLVKGEAIPDKQDVKANSVNTKTDKLSDEPKAETVLDNSKCEIASNNFRFNSQSQVVDDDIEVVYMKMPESEEILKKTIELKLPLNFYDYEKMPPCPGCRGCSDEVPAVSPIRQTLNNESLTRQTLNTDQESLFSSAIAASNVNQTNWQTNNANKPLWLVNSPAPIFSSNRNEDDDSVAGNADIYFKPLIPLPELVEVKTGEEDEEPIYCQRAKLYRYDPTLKEWKERGIGDFKILKHKYKNRYRMILRRDQILKIACNHYITPSMSLNPMSTSETAVCWYAVDFTDGNSVDEQFALKLKNRELLKEFVKVFTDCKKDLENNENCVHHNHSNQNEDQNDDHHEGDEDTESGEDQQQE